MKSFRTSLTAATRRLHKRIRPSIGRDLDALEARTLLSMAVVGNIGSPGTFPDNIVVSNGNVYYETKDPTNTGVDLVMTTPSGTTSVLGDFKPTSAANSEINALITNVTASQTKIYFDVNGSQLWVADSSGAQLVEDFSSGFGAADFPDALTPVGDNLFFTLGSQLYATDGSPGVALAVPGFNPGGSTNLSIEQLAAFDGKLFVSVSNNTTGAAMLLSTDGVQATPTVIAQFPAPTGHRIEIPEIEVAGPNLYFFEGIASSTTANVDVTQGAAGVFTQLTTITTSTAIGATSAQLQAALAVGDNLFFTSAGAGNSLELWFTGGTAAGTVALKTFSPDPALSNPSSHDILNNFTAVGSDLIFSADDSTHEKSLWQSDGTVGGTTFLASLPASDVDGYLLGAPTVAGSNLFFTTIDSQSSTGLDLWGLSGGTLTKLANLSPLSYSMEPSNKEFAALGNDVVFSNNNGTSGVELWTSDGTPGGTQLLKDINSGSASSFPYELTVDGSEVYFGAIDGTGANELWKTDGTATGTTKVASFSPALYTDALGTGLYGGTPTATLGGKIYFSADDGVHGSTLWSTNGTTGGTSMVEYLKGGVPTPLNGGGADSSSPSNFEVAGSDLYFITQSPAGQQLWFTDGTTAGTNLVAGLSGKQVTAYGSDLSVSGGKLYFFTTTKTSSGTLATGFWSASGGTATELASFTTPGAIDSASVFAGSNVFFAVDDGSGGSDLYVSNESPGGSTLLKDFAKPTNGSIAVTDLTALGSKVVFSGASGSSGNQLWISDGTVGGTAALKSSTGGTVSTPSQLTAAGSLVYFVATDGLPGAELWATDGTQANTTELDRITLYPTAIQIQYLASEAQNLPAQGSRVYFEVTGYDSSSNPQASFWTSNGTASSTLVLLPMGSGGVTYQQSNGAPAYYYIGGGNTIVFLNDGVHGIEPWITNGTVAGTSLVQDINPGSANSFDYDTSALVVGGELYFAANDGVHGSEIWQTNGTTTGTALFQDVNPGALGSFPFLLGALNGNLIVDANDGTNGSTLLETAPSVGPIANQGLSAGSTLSLTATASSFDGSTPTFSLAPGAPAAASINSATGAILWNIPGNQASGTYSLTVLATDPNTHLAGSQTFLVVVGAVPPTLTPIANQLLNAGATLSQTVSATTIDGGAITYSLASAPAGATIDPNTGLITWGIPGTAPTVNISFTVVAHDQASGLSSSESFIVGVIGAAVGGGGGPVLGTIPPVSLIGETLFYKVVKHKKTLIGFELTFSGALNQSSAQSTSSFGFTQTIKKKKALASTPVAFSVAYKPSANVVDILFAGKPKFSPGGTLVVSPNPGAGLIDGHGSTVATQSLLILNKAKGIL